MTYVSPDFGTKLTCPAGSYITSFCGSGLDTECGKEKAAILGCKSYIGTGASTTSITTPVSQGRVAVCGKNEIVSGVCISDNNKACSLTPTGNKVSTVVDCATAVDNAFSTNAASTWEATSQIGGIPLTPNGVAIPPPPTMPHPGWAPIASMTCPDGWVVTGICNTGGDYGKDCPENLYGRGSQTHLQCGKLRDSQHELTALLSIDESIDVCPATLDAANTKVSANRANCTNTLCNALGATSESMCKCLNERMPAADQATKCCKGATGCIAGEYLDVETVIGDSVFNQALASASVTNLLKRFSQSGTPPDSVATCCTRSASGDACDPGNPADATEMPDCKTTDPIYAQTDSEEFQYLHPVDTRNLPDNVGWTSAKVGNGWYRQACLSFDGKCISDHAVPTPAAIGWYPPDNKLKRSAIPAVGDTFWLIGGS